MKSFLKTLLHFAYTCSLIVVFLIVTLNIAIPVSLKWPTYCSSLCRSGIPMRDQCQSFCQLHEDTYMRVKSFSGFSTTQMKSLLDKESLFLAPLLANPPGWFILLNILFCVCSFISAIFWVATILSDIPAKWMKRPARIASHINLAIFSAYAMSVIFVGAQSTSDFYRKIHLYSRKELMLLGTMIANPVLQLLVIRNIPGHRKC